jgi:hypothetical protein
MYYYYFATAGGKKLWVRPAIARPPLLFIAC